MQSDVHQAFLFADLSGFTALTESHSDSDAADVAGRLVEMARNALTPGARVVKSIGDEVMIVCPTPAAAVRIAAALFRAVDDEPRFPTLRIGIHAGASVERDGDYFGATVNLCARIADHARPGQILCSGEVVRASGLPPGLVFNPVPSAALKNVRQPVSLFELVLPERPGPSGVLDPVCRMRLSPHRAVAETSHGGLRWFFCSEGCRREFREHPERYTGAQAG